MRPREILSRAVAVVLPALALGAAGALAATVQVREQHRTKADTIYTAEYSAAEGERNDLVVSRGANGGVTFADSGAVVLAQSGCTQVDARTAHCSRGGPVAQLGDLDDRARADAPASVSGGSGDDVLEGDGSLFGGPGADLIRNGDADARVSGGAGSDRVLAGGGDDELSELEDGEPDLLAGGAGHDTLEYPDAARAFVDLSTGRGGSRDDDTLRDIESASAAGGTFRGNGGANGFVAGESPSTMHGGGGADALWVSAGPRDRIDGGPGDDVLRLTGTSLFNDAPARDSIRCGPGADEVSDPAPNTLIPVDCEEVDFSGENGPDVALRGRRAGPGLATLRWDGQCGPNYEPGPCRVKAAVHEAVWPDRSRRPTSGRALGLARGTLARTSRRLDVLPGRHGRAVLASGRCVIARLKITGTGTAGSVEALLRLGRRCRPAEPIAP